MKLMELYRALENLFERISAFAASLLRNSLVFIAAIVLVVWWLYIHDWKNPDWSSTLRDVILAISFLSFFIIQKTFSHFSQTIHLKLNELVVAHENARNLITKAEDKTEEEIKELADEHDRIIESKDTKPDE